MENNNTEKKEKTKKMIDVKSIINFASKSHINLALISLALASLTPMFAPNAVIAPVAGIVCDESIANDFRSPGSEFPSAVKKIALSINIAMGFVVAAALKGGEFYMRKKELEESQKSEGAKKE